MQSVYDGISWNASVKKHVKGSQNSLSVGTPSHTAMRHPPVWRIILRLSEMSAESITNTNYRAMDVGETWVIHRSKKQGALSARKLPDMTECQFKPIHLLGQIS